MDYFNYRQGRLYAEETSITEIANHYNTPCYIYSRAALEQNYLLFEKALANYPHLICYAVKANSNLAILNLLSRLGAGFDLVSQGELERAVIAGGNLKKMIFSGVAKKNTEMARALELGIYCFNIESTPELLRLQQIAYDTNKIAPIALRINPNINVETHPYIATGLKENKFGIDLQEARDLFKLAISLPNIQVKGIACHIGSQLTTINPFIEALDCLLNLVDELKQQEIILEHLDLGGGLAVRYQHENPPEPAELITAILKRLKHRELRLILEPGRAIVGNAGILVTKIEYIKKTPYKNFAIVDAAMNDLLRPALYQAEHKVIPVNINTKKITEIFDIVGPVCETADFLAKERELAIIENDLLAICTAGAYGYSMSSNYNSRPRAAEVMVSGTKHFLIRRRESLTDLWAGETIIP